MSDVGLHHQQVSLSYPGDHAASGGAGIERGELANGVAVADDQLAVFTFVLQILRTGADGAELIDDVVAADGGVSFDHDVRFDPGSLADPDPGTNDGVGAYFHLSSSSAAGSTTAVGCCCTIRLDLFSLVWCLTNTVMKLRGHFGCRQGVLRLRFAKPVLSLVEGLRTSSGGHHARKSNAADGQKDPQIHNRICETPH